MARRAYSWAVTAIALLTVSLDGAHATVLTSGCANVNVGCTLQELFDGGTIVVDDKLFADFAFESAFPSPGPDPDEILVVPLDTPGNLGLRFVGNEQLTVSGPDVLDFAFNFSVSTTNNAALIVGNTLGLTEFEFTGADGRIVIEGTIFDGDFLFVNDNRVEADQSFGTFDLLGMAAFDPLARLFVEIDISLTGDSLGETVSLNGFEERFSQREVPEPGSLVVLMLGVVGLGMRRWRRKTMAGSRQEG